MTTLTYRQIALLSLPVILANITLPIQGLIDVAIIGHLKSPDYLSAVGLAGQLFSLLFVSLNFLQYASSGLAAQALGEKHIERLQRVLLRALLLAVAIGIVLILSQRLWLVLGQWFFMPRDNIGELLATYYSVRIWGTPFELANYAFIGWFAGQSCPNALFRQQLLISVSNVLFNLLFVLGFHWDVFGVALGTLIANALGVCYALYLSMGMMREHGLNPLAIDWQRLKQRGELVKLLRLNRDIWIRTTILTLSLAWITRLSTQQGELILAGNIILLQLLTLAAFAIDGIAVTTESQVGQAYGNHNPTQLQHVVRLTTTAAFVTAVLIATLFVAIRPLYLTMMTDIDAVIKTASHYYYFAAFIPVVAVLAYQFDGVMFGLTANTVIRNSMLVVAVIFFPVSWLLSQLWSNVGVWLSLYLFFLLRGGILVWQYTRITGKS